MSDIIVKSILPEKGESHSEQFKDCLSQINNILSKEKISHRNILKQSVFISSNNKSFKTIRNDLSKISNDFFKSEKFTTSFIGQIPVDQNLIAIEFTYFKNVNNISFIDHKVHKQFRYVVVDYCGAKTIYCGGLNSENLETGVLEQSKEVFRYMEEILSIENMNFSNIFRQWNYIENITGFDQKNKGLQNYQIFNDVRSEFYKKNNFINGYPSATGIGMNAGGVIIEFIASEFSKNIEIIPISSPLQHDAYRYSKEVLVGDSDRNGILLSTPKFERAKVVRSKNNGTIFVSGTAAIDGQHTIIDNSIEKQTLNTINNIKKLISEKNLLEYGVFAKDSFYSNIRVYVKRNADINSVQKIFESEFQGIDILYLISDICREKLLIEIEAIISF